MPLTKTLPFLLFVACALAPGLARAECLDAKAVEALRADFTLEAPEGITLKIDLCDERSTAFAALRTLLFVKELPSLDQPKSEFNQNFISTSPYQFFKDRVKKLVLDERSDSDSCTDDRLAFVSSYMRAEKKFWVCPNAANFGVITLSSAFIHEARHEEGGEYAHKICSKGPYANQMSCDQSYEDGGAYAIGLEYLVKLSRAPNLSAEIRERARSLAMADFLQRFNDLPLGLRSGALLRDDASGVLSFYDGNQETPIGLKTAPHVILSSQAGLPLLFDAKNIAKIYAYRGENLSAPISDVLTRHFDEALAPAERSEVKDVIYSREFACLLLSARLICYGPDREPFNVAVNNFVPKRFVYGEKSRLLGPGTVALLGEDGFLYQLPPKAEALRESKSSAWLKSSAPATIAAALPWPGGELLLDPAGALSTFSYAQRKAAPLDAFRGRKFRDLVGPFVWSKKLEEL
ncbi:MAG: hypothetical protein EOP11_01125 [Proteobacteria bacterium]|nr:MAG: hypothetical protein EOP11_01125 [Pseudomonadota bacterium]